MSWKQIFKVGAEGGSLIVMGCRDGEGQWHYAMVRDERTMKCLTDEFSDDELCSLNYSDNWEGILSVMDKYPWARLYPQGPFHEEFKDLIWAAAQARGLDRRNKDEWAELCGREPGQEL